MKAPGGGNRAAAKDSPGDAVERKLEEVQEGLAYINRRNDAVLRELKRLEATVNKAVETVKTVRTIAVVTIIVLLALLCALALALTQPWG